MDPIQARYFGARWPSPTKLKEEMAATINLKHGTTKAAGQRVFAVADWNADHQITNDLNISPYNFTTTGTGRFDGGIGINADPSALYFLYGGNDETIARARLFNDKSEHTDNELRLDFALETTTQQRNAVTFISSFSGITDATRTSDFIIRSFNSGSAIDLYSSVGNALTLGVTGGTISSPSSITSTSYIRAGEFRTGDTELDDGFINAGDEFSIYTNNGSLALTLSDSQDATFEGDVEIKGDTFWVGDGSGLPYGCLTGLDETVTCTDQNTWYQVTFDAIKASNNTTPSTANNDIVIEVTGDYKIGTTACLHTSNAQDIELLVKKENGTVDIGNHIYQTTGVAGKVENTAASTIAGILATDTLELWVRCTSAAAVDVIFDHVNLNCCQKGG